MGRRRKGKFLKLLSNHYRNFTAHHGQDVIDFFEFPIKIVLLPFTLAFDIAGSAPRGFGVPELISKLSAASIFAVATLGAYDIALDMGRKVLSPRNCGTCLGWQTLQCTMCKGTGKVHYQVKYYTSKSGEKPTAERVADAVVENRAELVHLPSVLDLHMPLPTKDCPTCDGTGAMRCPGCKDKFPLTISTDDIVEPPWKAYNILSKMHYPYEHIVHSMKDPRIAAFWLISMPQIVGGFNFDEEVKQKIWWQYMESMRYDRVRDAVAKRGPGWENLQEALITLDPSRARDDPVIVKNIPYFQARKTLEAEVMKLEPPPRPQNWGIVEPPWKAYNILSKMHYPYEHIVHSMKDPRIAAFWLISMPQIVGGFNFDEEVKQKIWWQYMESMRYDRVRDTVAKRGPGWENLQEALITLDPSRARDDPVIVKNIPYFQARKTLEAEVMKLEPPPRPQDWGDLNLPLDESCWTEEDLKDPKKLEEMSVLLNAQKEMASKFLDAQWEANWREEKVNQILEEKVHPYIQNVENSSLPEPIVIRSQNEEKKHQRRWWLF